MTAVRRLAAARLPSGPATLRQGVLAWRDGHAIVIADEDGTRACEPGWTIDHHELSRDGRHLLIHGDEGRRAQVWETRQARRLVELVGDAQRRQSLAASLVTADARPLVLLVRRAQRDTIRVVGVDGAEQGWLAADGATLFVFERAFTLRDGWIGIAGHYDGEQYDSVIALDAARLGEPTLLHEALREQPAIREWGQDVAIGPAGPGQIVVFRDAAFEEEDRPDDPDEALRGFELWDLESRAIVERLPSDAQVANLTTLGCDGPWIAAQGAHGILVVERRSGHEVTVPAVAMDPHTGEVAVIDGGTLVVEPLTSAVRRAALTPPVVRALLVRRELAEAPAVAFQAYLAAQMSGSAVDAVLARLGVTRERAAALRELLGPIFDDPTLPAAEYARWLGPPTATATIDAPGSFSGSTLASWTLPAWPELRFGVSAHPEGHAWDMRFEGGATTGSPRPGHTTFEALRLAGVQTQDRDHWPPMREVIATYPDGRAFTLRFDFELLQSATPLGRAARASGSGSAHDR